MEKREARTVKILPSIWKKAKYRCLDLNKTMGEYLENLIRKDAGD